MSTPVAFAFVTGHEFGEAAFRSLLDLPEYGRTLECRRLICLDQTKSKYTVGYQDLGPFAQTKNVRVEYVRSIKTPEAELLIRAARPDFILVIGWSELAPDAILDIPKRKHSGASRHSSQYGCIGIHPSLLPEGRGRAPIPWAIIKGLSRTGVTAFLLESKADSGGIIEQIEIPVEPTETATTLFKKARAAHAAIGTYLGRVMAARALKWKLPDERLATIWPRRRPEDGEIDFTTTPEMVDRLVRALTAPYPGAFFVYGGSKIHVKKVRPVCLEHSAAPGTIIDADPTPIIAMKTGAVSLEQFEPPEVRFDVGTLISRTP